MRTFCLRSFDRDQQAVALFMGLIIVMFYWVRPCGGLFFFSHDKTGGGRDEPVEAFIEVMGIVKRPGIYLFDAAPSCVEAVRKGGGIAEGVVLDTRNRMLILKSGDRLTIVKKNSGEAGILITEMDADKRLALGIPVNINSADAEGLTALPGIGSHLAARIVRFREERGPFKSPDELLRISGIGKKKLKRLRPYLRCGKK